MTQQYYGPPAQQPYGQPQPQQGYQQYQQPAPQAYGVPAQPGTMPPPNPYAQPNPYQQPGQTFVTQPPVPQGPPLPQGSLEDFFNQRSVGSGKGLSWNGKPDGYRYVGVVAKTPGNSDVFVDTQPAAQGGQPKQNRDGSFKYVLQVQLRLAWLDQFQQFTYPEQDARLFLRGGLRDEVTRAMHEAGDEGVPKEGALVDVTLTGRKPGNNIATNVFAVVYRPAGTWENDPAYAWVLQALNQAPNITPHTAPQQYTQTVPNPNTPAYAQPGPFDSAPAPQQAPYQQQAQYSQPQAAPNPQQYATPYPQPSGTMPQAAVAGPAPQYEGQAYDPNQQNGQPQTAPQYGQAPAGAASAGDQAAYPNQQNPQQVPQGQQPQQMQLPYGATQGQPNGQQPGPTPQPGTTGSALDPARQQLLARMTGGQAQPQAAQG